jgi:hypothetical protein
MGYLPLAIRIAEAPLVVITGMMDFDLTKRDRRDGGLSQQQEWGAATTNVVQAGHANGYFRQPEIQHPCGDGNVEFCYHTSS